MPQVLIWKCPRTGKLFENKAKYQRHLKKLAGQRQESKKLEIQEHRLDAWWNTFQNTEVDIADLPNLIIEHQKYFWAEAQRLRTYGWRDLGKTRQGVKFPVPKLLKFEEFSVVWSDSVSNSHHSPRNGVRNFTRVGKSSDGSALPRGYPGWSGRASWIVRWPAEWDGWYPGSELFITPRCGIHSGSGGGGGMGYDDEFKCRVQHYSYGISIFAADWPGLARFREKKLMWQILSNKEQLA